MNFDSCCLVLLIATLSITAVSTVLYWIFFARGEEKTQVWARRLLFLSWVLQSSYIVLRMVQVGNTPVTTYHEAVFFFGWAITTAYFSFRLRYRVKNFGTFVSPLICLLLFAAAFISRQVIPLDPKLQSIWLPVHASLSLLAYGFLGLGFCGGIMYLLQERELKSRKVGYFFSRLPSLEALDQLITHCVTIGFTILTVGMITGVLWSRQVYGIFFRWQPKEIFSLLIWLAYLFQIHQRYSAGYRGRRTAALAVAGFSLLLLTLWPVIT
jgi:cytochrome c-type biogenesis protein CcsB